MPMTFEKQPRESAKAFAAFSAYLGMGPERSLAAVGAKLGKSKQMMEKWSKKYAWSERVQAHGAYLAAVEAEATALLVRGKAVEWLKRQQEAREREWEMHEKHRRGEAGAGRVHGAGEDLCEPGGHRADGRGGEQDGPAGIGYGDR